MKWTPFRIKRHHELSEELPDVESDREGSSQARRGAETELRRIKSQRTEVCNASRKLRDMRERNHFAEMIGEALAERSG